MDTISIKELRVKTKIGVTAAERANEQELLVDVELFCDTHKAGRTDAIEDTIDYSAIAAQVRAIAKKEHTLIEAFAEQIAAQITGAYKVIVRVKKPGAIPDATYAAVEVMRG